MRKIKVIHSVFEYRYLVKYYSSELLLAANYQSVEKLYKEKYVNWNRW